MRRPRLHRPTPAIEAWARPYTGVASMAVFYNGDPTPPAPAPAPSPADLAARTAPPAAPAPAPAAGDDEEKVTFTQRRLTKMMAEEKDEGRRAVIRQLATAAGIDPETFDPTKFGEMFQQAEQERQAKLSEQERRAEDLAKRERELEAEKQALAAQKAETAQRDRESKIRAALVTLGATGDDLDDATALLRSRIDDTADDDAITTAAAALKERRAELFGGTTAQPQTLPPAPSGAPAGGPPRTPAAGKDAIKAAARQKAIERGLRTDDAA